MSFAQPAYLLALLLVPAAVAAYVAFERRRRAAESAFAAPAVFDSVTAARPGWRRHMTIALYAVATVPLIAALARPERTVAVPDERAAIVLAIDRSGSMAATDVAPSRLEAARIAVRAFLAKVPERIEVGLVAYDHTVQTLQSPTGDRARVLEALASIRPRGGTATGEALAVSLASIRARSGEDPAGAIVLLSDGVSTHGREPIAEAREASELGVPVYTVALGTASGTIDVPIRSGGTVTRPVPPDPATLEAIAERSGGLTFAAADARSLSAVYERLGSSVGRREEKRELTAGFAGGALVLLVAGGLLSLHWFRRLP
ncbi:MAG TPA: VWA domain-containing protein [Thermoleophilaceae bacterium]|nr:VWA domain-containing protein [Thermoleophilaceae bacterium]